MLFQYNGAFSHGRESVEQMRVTFVGRAPVDVTEEAAIRWFDGHPDYSRVPEVVETEEVEAKPKKKAKK